jgi:HAE1 family hydrophobic/amphiphilic exporter-1
VGNVEMLGGQKREIEVELRRAAVFERGLSVTQVAGILSQANIELPGGNIDMAGQDIPVRFKGEFPALEAIGDLDIPIRGVNGTDREFFKLRQLADIKDSHETVRERTIFLDKGSGGEAASRTEDALLVQVFKNPSANTIGVIDGVTKILPRIERESGGDVRFKIVREDATFIRDSVSDTLSNLIMGIILTGFVLLVFLHDWRSTLIITIAMPFSIIATFLVMQWMGIGVNILSLMGLSCAVGTLVANSVVVLENIFRHKALGLCRTDAAATGTKEVVMAVLASTATNVAVFVPLGSMQGTMGQILSHFAWAVVISTVFSLVASFTITPLLASRMLPEQAKAEGAVSKKIDAFFAMLERGYAASVAAITKRRLASGLVVIAVFGLFVLSIIGFSRINMEILPKSDNGRIDVEVELSQGSNLEATAKLLQTIEEKLAAYDEVSAILTSLGADGDTSVASMEITLIPKARRALSSSDLTVLFTKTLSTVPGADIRVIAPAALTIAEGAPIDLYIKGEDNLVLQALGDDLRSRMEKVPGVMFTATNTKSGKREIVFEPKRKRISEDGLSVQQVALALRSSVDGLVTTTFKSGGEEFDIRVKLEGSAVSDINDLRNIPIATSRGIFPLSRYADIGFEKSYNMVLRTNKARTVEVTAELLPGYAQGAVLNAVMAEVSQMDFPAGYSVAQAGLSDAMGEGMMDMVIVFLTAIVLVYILLAAILESLSQPLFILSTVPLSLIGIAASCLLTNITLNNIAMMRKLRFRGIVMLVGIVVNNAILLLDYYNQLRRHDGLGCREALLKACPAKLKPILMSNIAIILGMIPMALGIGASLAEMRQPMGIIVTGGIISSTIMTLWLVPALEFVLKGKVRVKGGHK